MKRLTILFAVLAVFLWVGSAWATPTVDGVFNLGEWAGYYAADDGVGDGGFVGPGWGGQAYDVEYLGLYITSDKVYFGLQTGFDVTQNSSVPGVTPYSGPGDFALDVDGDSIYDYAIDFTISNGSPSFSLYDVTSWQNVYYTSGTYDFSESNPFQMSSGTQAGNNFSGSFGSGVFSNNIDGGKSYVLEGSFDKSLLGAYSGAMTLHWTMWCGNDHLEQTSAPVPEPATMLLFGVGLCGLAFVGRKKLIKQG